jgi:hypothetical protein
MNKYRFHRMGLALVAFLAMAASGFSLDQTATPNPAEPSEPSEPSEHAELAKKLSNPISDLVSVPFQLNWEQGVGPDDQTRFLLNVQPVMPFQLNDHWNLIARVIVPLVSQPPLFEGGAPDSGVSDILTSAHPGRSGAPS